MKRIFVFLIILCCSIAAILFLINRQAFLSGFEKVKDMEQTSQNVEVDMKIVSNKKDFHYPEPIAIQVFLYRPYPISGAKVSAIVTSPSGKNFKIPFTEDFLLGPTLPGSGSYVGMLTDLEEDGQYQVGIEANDNNGKAYFAKQLGEELPDTQRTIDNSSPRTVGSFQIQSMISINVFGYVGKFGLPPLKITTLYASVDSDQCVYLFWEVPINIGPDGEYEIRYSSQSITSERAWSDARLAYKGKYTRKGGETHEHKICGLGKGIFYFAVRSVNSKDFQSEISNDYIVIIR